MSANLESSTMATELEKGQFQRKKMPKNVQTTAQLHSFHMPGRLCSKSFKLGFSITWTEKFQTFKLGLEKAEKLQSKLLTFAGSYKAREFQKNTYLFHWLRQSLCVDHDKLWKTLKKMGIPDHLTCLLRNLYAGQEATVRTSCRTAVSR